MNPELDQFVIQHLSQELNEVENSHRKNLLGELSVYEKAVIYKYTEDAYEALNEDLRNGKSMPLFGKYLNYSLEKLPNFKLLCYRTITSNRKELDKYYEAFANDSNIIENSFLSCTKSKLIALQFSESPLFIIKSKRGKEIENIAKFGIESGQNEKEILFKSNSKFRVLNINEETDKTVITLEEI